MSNRTHRIQIQKRWQSHFNRWVWGWRILNSEGSIVRSDYHLTRGLAKSQARKVRKGLEREAAGEGRWRDVR